MFLLNVARTNFRDVRVLEKKSENQYLRKEESAKIKLAKFNTILQNKQYINY